jgi:hypothetical protein
MIPATAQTEGQAAAGRVREGGTWEAGGQDESAERRS